MLIIAHITFDAKRMDFAAYIIWWVSGLTVSRYETKYSHPFNMSKSLKTNARDIILWCHLENVKHSLTSIILIILLRFHKLIHQFIYLLKCVYFYTIIICYTFYLFIFIKCQRPYIYIFDWFTVLNTETCPYSMLFNFIL